MKPTIRPFEDRDLDGVVDLPLRAWDPVFASLESLLGESGVYALLHPDWRGDQRRTVEAACGEENAHVWSLRRAPRAGSSPRGSRPRRVPARST
jgi:hypothetical protein